MTTTQPMPSAKIYAGKYEVLGTTHECIVEEYQWVSIMGWKLMVDGQFHKSFRTKREALVYCQEHPEL
jgi:hypothetical protein